MTKKIRKRSPHKWNGQNEKKKIEKLNGIPIYKDE